MLAAWIRGVRMGYQITLHSIDWEWRRSGDEMRAFLVCLFCFPCIALDVDSCELFTYHQTSNINAPNPKTQIILVLSCCCLCPLHWRQVLSQEWMCSCSSNFIGYKCVTYIRSLMAFLSIVWLSTEAVTRLSQCQRKNPKEYGIDRSIPDNSKTISFSHSLQSFSQKVVGYLHWLSQILVQIVYCSPRQLNCNVWFVPKSLRSTLILWQLFWEKNCDQYWLFLVLSTCSLVLFRC